MQSSVVAITAKLPARGLLDVSALEKISKSRTPVGDGAFGVVLATKVTTRTGEVKDVAIKVAHTVTSAVVRELAALGMLKAVDDICQLLAADGHSPICLPLCVCIQENTEVSTAGRRHIGAKIIMEKGERSLKAESDTNHIPVDSVVAATVIADLLQAQCILQRMGLAHRDIKPGNTVVNKKTTPTAGAGAGKGKTKTSVRATVVDMGSLVPAAGGLHTPSRFPPATTDTTGFSTVMYSPPVAGPPTRGGVQYTSGHAHDAWSTAMSMMHVTGHRSCTFEVEPDTFRTPSNQLPRGNNGCIDPISHARYSAALIQLFGGIDTTRPYVEALRSTAQAVLSCNVDLRVRLAAATLYPRAPGARARASATAGHVYVTSRMLVPENHVNAEGGVPTPASRTPAAETLHKLYTDATRDLRSLHA